MTAPTAIGYVGAALLILLVVFGPGGVIAWRTEKRDQPDDELTSIADAVGVMAPQLPLRQAAPGDPLTPKEAAALADLEAQFTVPTQRMEKP